MTQQTQKSEKKPYETPKLAELGKIEVLTETRKGNFSSGGGKTTA